MSINNGEINDPVERQLAAAHELLNRSREVLSTSVEAITGDPTADPLEVFPAPGQPRLDGEFMNITPAQEETLRTAAAKVGFGRETDKGVEQTNLKPGYKAFIHGGMIHKVLTEIDLVRDSEIEPSAYIIGAAAFRKIDSEDPRPGNQAEVASIRHQLGLTEDQYVLETEYSISKKLLEKVPGYRVNNKPVVLPYSYDIYNNNYVGDQKTGQFTVVGAIDGKPVVMMRIDQHNLNTEWTKFDKRPDASQWLEIVHQVMTNSGDTETQLSFVTSSTYEASFGVDGVRAVVRTGRPVELQSYGTHRLAKIKGEEPQPPNVQQLPGELHKLALQTGKLADELAKHRTA